MKMFEMQWNELIMEQSSIHFTMQQELVVVPEMAMPMMAMLEMAMLEMAKPEMVMPIHFIITVITVRVDLTVVVFIAIQVQAT